MSQGFKLDASSMLGRLAQGPSKVDSAVRMYAEACSPKLSNYAKENRKWTDRTGAARQRLHSYVGKISIGYRITLAHGVSYGIWLELANEKRFAIIPESIETVGTKDIMPGFERLMERLNL